MSYKNEVGLFLGLLSYPFDLDGKKFYTQKIEKFFEKHREFLHQYDVGDLVPNENDKLYIPKGYRMFGTQGLAVLSLVDDYSFFTRVFSKNHIQSILNKGEQDKKESPENEAFNRRFHFKSVVTSGVMETIIAENGDTITLNDLARKTFLKDTDRYTYIGIIRLKIDSRVLSHTPREGGEFDGITDQGIAVTKQIRTAIHNIKNDEGLKGEPSEYICVDCFDNDEMTVVAFANNLLFLYNFLGEIRSLKCTDLDNQEYKVGNKVLKEKHVFLSSLLCFGYDPDKAGAVATDENLNGFYINCLIESKTGHRDSLFGYLHDKKKDLFEENNLTTNITGGCNIIAKIPLAKIASLEKVCEEDPEFKYHTRKVKISLPDVPLDGKVRKTREVKFDKSEYEEGNGLGKNKIGIDESYLNQLRNDIKALGISKAVRDRMMALFELFNNEYQNLLQQVYLDELKDTLEDFVKLIEDFRNNPVSDICDIEKNLNYAIDNMESAIYDRLHRQKYSQAPLEYNGGIQQYLTSFDHAYKTIAKALGKDEKVYVTITGAVRASSIRNLFRLNINDIVYPELFAYAVWKEATNYAHEGLKKYAFKNDSKDPKLVYYSQLLRRWNMLLIDTPTDSRVLDNIKYRLYHDSRFNPGDPVHRYIYDNVSNGMLSYFFQDFLVFHFSFLKDFELMWHMYLKTMLQTTNCYYRLNKINKCHLIYMLLRLFMVSKMSVHNSADIDEFIREQKKNPFDASLNEAWIDCFQKTFELSEIIYEVISTEEFQEICGYQIECYESRIDEKVNLDDKTDNLENVIIRRRRKSQEIRNKMDEGEVVAPDSGETPVDYLVCLLNAYLGAVYDLDYPDKKKHYPIKSVPRDSGNGSILDIKGLELKDVLNEKMSNILSDPTGGYFTRSAQIRLRYFTYRTVLYRSLWNFRFTK